jgi:hypothetical protein
MASPYGGSATVDSGAVLRPQGSRRKQTAGPEVSGRASVVASRTGSASSVLGTRSTMEPQVDDLGFFAGRASGRSVAAQVGGGQPEGFCEAGASGCSS